MAVSPGDDSSPRSSELPRRGGVLPSLGGSKISTGRNIRVERMSSSRVVRVRPAGGLEGEEAAPQVLRDGIAEIQSELQASSGFRRGRGASRRRSRARLPDLDRTDPPMVRTVDPRPRWTDQALYLACTDDGGYVLYYAIADLAAFITPGDPVDVEAHQRGQTLYGADSRIPLRSGRRSRRAVDRCRPTRSASSCWMITMRRGGRAHRRGGGAGAGDEKPGPGRSPGCRSRSTMAPPTSR